MVETVKAPAETTPAQANATEEDKAPEAVE